MSPLHLQASSSKVREARFLLFLLAYLTILSSCLLPTGVMAATPPGTLIRSQAQAWFLDENDNRLEVRSNEVETLIQEVTGVRLDSSQSQWGVAGQKITLPHQLTNTGNIGVDYRLSLSSRSGLTGKLYLDNHHTGQPESQNRVSGPVYLAPGESVSLLLEVTVPSAYEATIQLTATVDRAECQNNTTAAQPTEQGRCQAVNTDTVKRSNGVVYQTQKSMDRSSARVGELVRVSLNFKRTDSTRNLSLLSLKDKLPEGLEYVQGSAELCDSQGNNCQFRNPEDYDPQLDRPLTFFLPGNPGHQGIIRFITQVTGGAGTTIFNSADYEFCQKSSSGWNHCVKQNTNQVPLKVTGAGVTLNGSQYQSRKDLGDPVIVDTAPSGGTVQFISYAWNTGTQPANYHISPIHQGNTFPAGSLYCLSKDDQCQSFTGQPSLVTQTLQPGEHQAVHLHVQLPKDFRPDASHKNGYALELVAIDLSNSKIQDNVQNWLLAIIDHSAGVDLTLGQTLKENASAPGHGSGPEASPLTTQTVQPGSTVVFNNLYVNNTGSVPDSYNLSLEPTQGSQLPKGISWQFLNSGNTPVPNSGIIKPDQSSAFKLVIQVPAQAVPGTWSLVVKAVSPVRLAQDKLHLAMTIPSQSTLVLEPDGRSQVTPGSFVTFAHRLTNTSNRSIDNIRLQLTDTMASSGWQSLVYNDGDGDGNLSATDNTIDGPFSLKAGETLFLLVKVFAPGNAPQGSENQTSLYALWGANRSTSVTDIATVNSSQVKITKEQALWDCNSSHPTRFSTTPFPVLPGSCVVYRLTATNHGNEQAHNVVIHDAAPNFTAFYSASGLPITTGKQPGDITTAGQAITATWHQGLAPGESVSLLFGIRIQ